MPATTTSFPPLQGAIFSHMGVTLKVEKPLGGSATEGYQRILFLRLLASNLLCQRTWILSITFQILQLGSLLLLQQLVMIMQLQMFW